MSAKRKTIRVVAALTVAASAAVAALPVPIYPAQETDGQATDAKLAPASPNEISFAFWAKFDKLPSEGTPCGLFDCVADKQGIVTFRLFAQPTEFQGDYAISTRTPVKKGEWHHFELSYTRQQTRAALYMDGHLQWENDNLCLPKLKFTGDAAPRAFTGEVKDLLVYDFPLANEYLALADDVANATAEIKATAKSAEAAAKSAALKEWAAKIAATCDAYAAAPDKVTCGALADLRRDAGNAAEIARALTDPALARVAGGQAALYTVNPVSQELYLPYSLPRNGEISTEMRIVACPGEYENGSLLAVAFRPLKVNNVTISDLRGPDGKTIPATEVNVKLVKRWYRTGGAWLSYHSDRRQRNLTPDLLVNDDSIIKVDEFRRKNYLRLDYPEGSRYADVSDPDKGHTSWNNAVPFRDSPAIRPHEIPEAGRNQQYMFAFHVPAGATPGLYRGRINLSIAGGDAGIDVALKVLPIALPDEPSSYADLGNVYISHMNHFPGFVGATLKEREDNARAELASIRAHNMFHTTGIWNTPELAKLALEAGLIPDKIFADKHPKSWRAFYSGIPAAELTTAHKEAGTRAAIREVEGWNKYLAETFPKTARQYVIYHSEDGSYNGLVNTQAEEAYVAHKLGYKVFAHTMNDKVVAYMGDIQDMNSSTATSPSEARMWHAAGGELINYADPFPGSENPEWYRRKIGMLMYKTGLDGQMMHGYRQGRTPWNEFAEDLGGDGNYRNFCLCYPMRNGTIYTVAWEGVREAFDDLRYATRLRQLAEANLGAEADPLRREARRAQLWLEKQDGKAGDLDMIRAGIISRILVLQDAIARHKGVLPDANMAVKR